MPIPPAIEELVERFERNQKAYHAGQYNEAQVRQEFINPFWDALGWDVTNKRGYSEKFKEVVHEDALKIQGKSRAPDYAFRLGGQRVFFVEAKKPAVEIKQDISPAYQLRRYAWSAKLPLSVLTDFEEFAVYDCRARPHKTDQASVARVQYLTYKDYPDQWDKIAGLFSPEAIRKGALDRYAASTKAKRGTAEVDAAFLAEIEGWRDALARNIALRNPGLSVRQLNRAVQITIDRLIFLRICEDRGIEPYHRLGDVVLDGKGVYRRLGHLFRQADDRYNSGLFHLHAEKGREDPDNWTLGLTVDDKVLKEILQNLYYPDCPYEFSVLPADILGQVYEQFLGKVIRLTAGGRAKVEEKPEVKKAGGVYYTPTYIVDYIVEHTVGKLLEDKTPRQVWGSQRTAPLRILDPACGSGTFLLQAYQYLLDWYLEQYLADDPELHARQGRLVPTADGDWRLASEERKRILLTHIHGVDIDPQAVEVTKLSLLLKVLEEEQGAEQLTFLQQERVLPDLAHNVHCGNSLIGPDYYQGQATFLDEEEMYRINAFDWKAAFPRAMAAGGFDVVIGNPPYVRQEMLSEQKQYLKRKYQVYYGTADLYVYFVERGISLLRPNGVFSYIVANKWMRVKYGGPLRHWLKQRHIEEIIDFGPLPVFKGATTYTCIPRIRNASPPSVFEAARVETLGFASLEDYVRQHRYLVGQTALNDDGWSLVDRNSQALLERLRTIGIPLKTYVHGHTYYGVKTGRNKAFVIDSSTRDRLLRDDPNSAKLIKPFLVGRDIKRYVRPSSSRFVVFTRRGVNIEEYPAIERYLSQFKEELRPKPAGWKEGNWKGRKPGPYEWYEIQDTVDYYAVFEKPKILWPGISAEVTAFAFDEEQYLGNDNTQLIVTSESYLLGVLNSRLSRFLLKHICDRVQGGFYRLKMIYVEQLPIRAIDFDDHADVVRYDRMEGLVERMLTLHGEVAQAKTPQARRLLEQQIAITDRQIDALVYELYDLTEDEIAIVEEATGE